MKKYKYIGPGSGKLYSGVLTTPWMIKFVNKSKIIKIAPTKQTKILIFLFFKDKKSEINSTKKMGIKIAPTCNNLPQYNPVS
jgi:hypothetical protein